MPRFDDDNTIGHIEGCYLLARRWPEFHPEFDVQLHLAEFVDRIQARLAVEANGIRHNWFTVALGYARESRQLYREGRIDHGRRVLELAWEHLDAGEKAARRRVMFPAKPRTVVAKARRQETGKA